VATETSFAGYWLASCDNDWEKRVVALERGCISYRRWTQPWEERRNLRPNFIKISIHVS
jgi:hypothetical protein